MLPRITEVDLGETIAHMGTDTEIRVDLDQSHLEELVATPVTGLLELIWNSIDADASRIEISFGRNELDGITEVRVKDDGHGMTEAELEDGFKALGASWKRDHAETRGGRMLHGARGQGRYQAAGIGPVTTWRSVTIDPGDGQAKMTEATIRADSLATVNVSGPEPTTEPVGTTVVITQIGSTPDGLGSGTPDRLLSTLAIDIEKYGLEIVYDNELLDPKSIQVDRTAMDLSHDAELEVIEWTGGVDRRLYLCDAEGRYAAELSPGIKAPGFVFTAYLRWEGFADESRVQIPELDPDSAEMLSEAREAMRRHFRDRLEDERRTQVKSWKEEDVYPFEGEPESETEEATRELFDVVAVTAREAVNSGEQANRRLSLRLLREAIEQNPNSLQKVLTEVVDLPDEQLEELSQLLSQTSLSNVIAASTSITDRLTFLKALEEMVCGPDLKNRVLERSQLHRILANETWVFGEEFSLTADDETLRSALKRHIHLLGRESLAPEGADVPVVDPGGRSEAVVDLMLARAVPQGTKTNEHLVVELKRPSVSIGPKEAQQIRDYALSVAQDDRFKMTDTQWDFVAVSTSLTGTVVEDAKQPNKPTGLLVEYLDGKVRVWAKTWSQVLEDADHRLKFVRERLGFDPTTQQAFRYLREKHAEFIPNEIAEVE